VHPQCEGKVRDIVERRAQVFSLALVRDFFVHPPTLSDSSKKTAESGGTTTMIRGSK